MILSLQVLSTDERLLGGKVSTQMTEYRVGRSS
jgi:hypothetical protein